MCWCNPNNRTPECGNIDCRPPKPAFDPPHYKPAKEASQKPPIGIMPERLWMIKRCQDLSGAIERYLKHDEFDADKILVWIKELQWNLEILAK